MMYFVLQIPKLALIILALNLPPKIDGHGRLIEPPSRASAWRYGFDTPHNYNDHESYCGGFTRQWVRNAGKCGVCGDPWDTKLPRAHEYGGTFGQGVIVRKYTIGATINIRVELTANHFGYFEFALCPDYKSTDQACLDQNVLKMPKTHDARFYPKDGNKVYEMKYKLPMKKCEHCVLQWRYIAANNWGNCANGTGAVGCGPQEEFRACADVAIAGRTDTETLEAPITTTTTAPPPINATTVLPPPIEHVAYSPISALIYSLVSFLVVFLVLSLIYFHFYQVGKQIKTCLRRKDADKTHFYEKNAPLPPVAPPRTKRQKSFCDGLDEVDLRIEESMA